MKRGNSRFEYFLNILEEKFLLSGNQPDQVLHLYNDDLRTPFFMLEGLAKLYGNLHNKKKFEKLKLKFKAIEDAIGKVDYYDGFVKAFSVNAELPDFVLRNLNQRKRQARQELEVALREDGWLKRNGKTRVDKIRKKLEEADWMNDSKEQKGIKKYYQKEIEEIEDFVAVNGLPFTKVEEQVHEFRRLIRWLSIYPHAMRGKIQLKEDAAATPYLEPYITDEVVHSKFNQFPPLEAGDKPVLLNRNRFFAISWAISELGKLKDEGLKYFAIAEAIQMENGCKPMEALHKAFEMTNQENPLKEILERSSNILTNLLNNHCLEDLMA